MKKSNTNETNKFKCISLSYFMRTIIIIDTNVSVCNFCPHEIGYQ
jgi:hypothetical protein